MMLHRASAILLIQLSVVVVPVAYSQREINGVASTGNTIHAERDIDLSSDRETVKITSPVPVTIQQYNDDIYVEGGQPVTANMAKVLVTSNCDTSQTEIDPAVAISSNGDITITLPGVSDEEAADVSFLDPSSYSAMWSYVSNCWSSNPLSTTVASLVDGEKCETGSAADPDKGCETDEEFCQLTMGACKNKSGIHNGVCEAIPEVCGEIYQPVCGCNGQDYSNVCDAHSASVSVSHMDVCGESSKQFDAIDGDFPTKAPSTTPGKEEIKPSTLSPSNLWDADSATEPSSAFNRSRSFSFFVAATLMVIVAISVIFPGNGGGNHLWGFSKFAVAAVAVSSLYPKSSIQKSNQGQKSSFHSQNERTLQACSFNVEVLLDGCTKSAEIDAPSGRVIDVSIDNQTSEQRPDDECTTDYEATLNFPVTDETQLVLNLTENVVFAAFDQFDYKCSRAVEGRPFVDATGGSLQAMPWVPGDELESTALSWTGEASMETQAFRMGNATTHGRFLMGEDWTQRALGEHASVASFSAFSIALMTNQAPSDLVNDALKAGLDEIRHARVSFEIASRLTGKEVGPGPLPPSRHEFRHDLTALALAVAREGCVDETLSAFAAAMEVEHINEVLEMEMQDDLYSTIGRDMLTSIRDELVTIAMDESNHSALAWRTLGWVCGVDSNACKSLYADVFEEGNLEKRFKQRADRLFGEKSAVLSSMRGEWMKIFNAYQLAHSDLDEKPVTESFCKKADIADDSGQPRLTSVTENVLRQVSCS